MERVNVTDAYYVSFSITSSLDGYGRHTHIHVHGGGYGHHVHIHIHRYGK